MFESIREQNHRARSRGRAALVAVVPLVLALSCGDDGKDDPPAPPGPVAMAIGKLRPRGAEVWRAGTEQHEADPEPIVLGCDGRLGVTVFVFAPGTLRDPESTPRKDEHGNPLETAHVAGDWLFRPPGACSRAQCGTLLVSVESVASGERATAQVALETAVVDLAPLGTAFAGRIRIRAELRENGGETVGIYQGQPLADELELDTVSDDCEPDGEGGAGGAPSTGGTTGVGGAGNQGGEAGNSGTGGTTGPGGAGGAPGAAGEGVGGA